jgi:hypothetical protein
MFRLFTKLFNKPSHDRDWTPDQVILPHAEINGNDSTIYYIRNFRYTSTTEYISQYYNKIFHLNSLKKVWYILVPIPGLPGSAHNFLSFEFENNQFLAISIEIRKKKGDFFNPFKGILNYFELMYVVADEEDVIKLRTHHRNNDVYIYPLRLDHSTQQSLFIDMVQRVNNLKDKPEFYNTLTNSCASNIRKHINNVSSHKIPWSLKMIFPGFSDALLYDLGLIDTTLPFEEAQKAFHSSKRALEHTNDPLFSVKIRQHSGIINS